MALSLVALVSCGGGSTTSSSSQASSSAESTTSQASSESKTSEEKTSSEETTSSEEKTSSEESSSDAVVYSVSITNKAKLQEDWYLNGGNRKVELDISPRGNLLELFESGLLKVESSDNGVVSASNATLIPVASGTATITVTYGDATDTVEVTLKAAQTCIDKYGTVHAGTAEDPLDNEDAIKVGKAVKEAGETSTTDEIYIKGTVESFYHAPGSRDDGAVSWYLTPATAGGEKFEIYKCYKDDSSSLTDDDIWKGALVTAKGKITFYNNQMETSSAILVSVEGEKPEAPKEITATVAEAITAGKALSDGDSTWDFYVITGYVVKKDGTNYFLSDSKTVADDADVKDLFELYNVTGADAEKLTKGAQVTIKAKVKNYHGQIENGSKPEITLVKEGEPWVINYIEKTVAEAITIINALEDGKTTDDYYKITGVVAEVTTAYNAQYGNISFTMGDAAGSTDLLTVFRLSCTEAEAKTIVAGAQVTVGGKLQKYVKDGATTPEFVQGKLLTDAPETIKEVDVDGALKVIDALEAGATTTEEYKISGRISRISGEYSAQYGNISIILADDAGHELTVFRLTCSAEEAKKLVVDNEVVVQAKLQKYAKDGNVTPEAVSGSIVSITENAYTVATVAEALTVISGLEDNATTEVVYKITGTVGAVTTPYSAQYGNISFTVGDSAEANDLLTVFRLTCSAEAANSIVAGAEVIIAGKLQKFVKEGATTPEFVKGKLLSAKAASTPVEVNYGTLEAPLGVNDLLNNDGTLCEKTSGSFSAQKVVVKGVLKSAEWSDKYGTWTVVLADELDLTKTIKATGLHLQADVAKTIAANDIVIVEHYLEYYNGGWSLYYKKDAANVYDYGDVLAREVGRSTVTVAENANAHVSELEAAYLNDTEISFTVVVAEGYEVSSVKVYDKEVEAAEGVYKFVVAGNAEIVVTTKVVGEEPVARESITVTPGSVTPSKWVNSYTGSFTVEANDSTITFNGVNNGSSGDAWTSWRIGRKDKASTASIVTDKIAEGVSAFDINVTQLKADGFKTAKIYSSLDGSNWTEAVDFSTSFKEGAVSVALGDNAIADAFYKVEIDMDPTGTNGSIRFGEVIFTLGVAEGAE